MASIDKLGLTEKTTITQKKPRGEIKKSTIPLKTKENISTDRGKFKLC